MQEVSDKVIVILVILAVLVSVIGTYAVTQMAFDVGSSRADSQGFSPGPAETVGQISLVVIDSIEEGGVNGGG
ncbi:MAG: hypothetical protein ABH849_02210 [Nanoarchaeota archaeon]